MCQINWNPPAQQGWQCPVCRTVNAPWSPTCLGCPQKGATWTSGGTTGEPIIRPTTNVCVSQPDLFGQPETD